MVDSKLMKNYPFLEDIWKKYNFDEAVNYSDESRIFSLCNNDVTYIGEHASEQKNICRKLLRNLKLLHSGTYMADDFVKCCNNINNWLYYKTKEDNISDDTINSIFAASNKIIEKKGYLDCSYFTFNKGFLEPEKLVMLRVFNNNADNIREILSNEFHSKICSCQKFIKQCVDLYKDMHEDHCSKGYTTNSSQEGTCEIVKSFRTLYEGYLTKDKIKYKIPELSSNTPTDIIDGCSSEETDSGPAPPEQSKQSGNSITQNTSHALASMVGIPPFLALIYKFTPIRKVFLSKNKKDTRAFNNLDQEIENEFSHHKYGDTNASQLKFNVSYSPV